MLKSKQPGVLFGAFLFLIMLTLTGFFIVAEDYYDFTANTLESASSVAPLSKETTLTIRRPSAEKFNTEVKYRTFFLTFPNAKQVELRADFNQWGKNPILLKPYKKGYFETSVALAAGEYKYFFLVDGEPVLDPSNMDRRTINGQEVCIKTVR